MKTLSKINQAIKFAIKTHEVYQKQKRKGKDIPYITHPLNVGIILAYIGADEDIICAGILHDTIEDSIEEKKVSFEMLEERFGQRVAQLVLAVTETDKSLSWEQRKREAKEHIKTFSNDESLLKSADLLANTSDIIEDHRKKGDMMFEKFHASKERVLENYVETIEILINHWPNNPFIEELNSTINKFKKIINRFN